MKRIAFVALLAAAGPAAAAPDLYPLVEVTAGRIDAHPTHSPYAESSLSEQAAAIPGVRLQRQGLGSPQADLRIRGGAFSSSGYALEGLPLFNAQTEHFHADLPLAPLLAENLRLLTGLEQFRSMSGHASGTLDMDLAEPDRHLQLTLAAGSDGFQSSSASGGWTGAAPAGGTLGGTLFLQQDQADKTDGREDNDLSRWSGGGLAQHVDAAETLRATLLAAGSSRRFGARGFYGAPASLPSEEEVETLLLLGSVKTLDPRSPFRLTAGWQRSEDRYWLDRTDRALYANRHETDEGALHADGLRELDGAWSVRWRGDLRRESIDSVYEGRLPSAGLGDHERSRLAAGVMPEWTRGDLTLSAGGAGEWFENDKPAWLPAAGASWAAAPGHVLFASATAAVRQPSFTELNYESPGSLGNQDLERQESLRGEAGWRGGAGRARGGVMLFADRARHVVDWVRTEAAARWTAVNLDSVETLGALVHGALELPGPWSLHGEYLGLDKSADAGVFSSRYVLDYPPHEWRAGLRVEPVPEWRLGLWQTVARYRDNPSRQGTRTQLESNLESQWRLPRAGLVLAAGLANLWDREFETLPGQPSAGRRGYLSASLSF